MVGKDPKDVPCEWCGEPSVVAVEQKKRGKFGWVGVARFKYACREHTRLAEELEFVKRRGTPKAWSS